MTALEQLRVGDIVKVPPVQTVIRLEQGRTDPGSIVGTFVLTNEVRNHLSVLADAFNHPSGTGCFVQGDFGSGKSHLLAALATVLGRQPGHERLMQEHAGLARLAGARNLLPVDISLVAHRSATPLERILTGAVEQALRERGSDVSLSPLRQFIDHLIGLAQAPEVSASLARTAGVEPHALKEWLEQNPRQAYAAGLRFLKEQGLPHPDQLLTERDEVFEHAMNAVRRAGFDGIVLIVDELSEFFRAKPDAALLNEDARTLQFIGELAQRQPLWIVAAVQESIERTGDIAQATFRKIKDRFPLRLHLSTIHIRDLIDRRLVIKQAQSHERILAIYERYRAHFTGFTVPAELFLGVYPVHPATLSLLEGLGDLFSQHRGIVDFVHTRVAGDPGRGIEGILDRPCTELLAPDSIYEHFSQRLMEFSSFHIYPRHIVPHLDGVIDTVLEDDEDRRLARRIVRMLVLFAIHPTSSAPTARRLAELAACTVSGQDPDLNAQFVAEVVLEPLASHSRFLARDAKGDDPLTATYRLTVEEDHSKTLRARVQERARALRPDDTRLVLTPLSEFDAPGSWPGKAVWEGVLTSAPWRQSTRRVFTIFVKDGMQEQATQRIRATIERGAADAALALVLESTSFHCDHTAVWRIPIPSGDQITTLAEFCALEAVENELRGSNPADAPLVPLAREMHRRLVPSVREALLTLVYAGHFDEEALNLRLEPAARQVRHFDRLVELAAATICEVRYPRFSEIAPRSALSLMTYQRLMDECIIPGSIPMRTAREKGLGEAVDSIARSLGLIEVRSGSCLLAPNPNDHPFLNYVFGLIRPGQRSPIAQVVLEMRTGPFGVPRDMAAFTLCSLAHSGLISLSSAGRTVPLEFLRTVSLEHVDAVAPGELITAADRETIVRECQFLAPDGAWPSFGLRQQRQAWQTLVKMKGALSRQMEQLSSQLREAESYSALRSFDLEGLRAKAAALFGVLEEVKVSYQPREGLERFLAAWRGSGLSADDLTMLRGTQKFLARSAQQLVFVSHYVRHRSVEAAAARETAIDERRTTVLSLVDDPAAHVVPDDGERLSETFALLQQVYAAFYAEAHATFYRSQARAPLSKQATRGLALLRRLRAITSLDESPRLKRIMAELESPEPAPCRRSLTEELKRAPVCDCGFVVGDKIPEAQQSDFAALIEQALCDYRTLLRTPEVGDALMARAYAVRDIDPDASTRLRSLHATLAREDTESVTALMDLLDESTMAECRTALAHATPVHARSLADLSEKLQGRRLTRRHIIEAVDEWIGSGGEQSVIAIEQASPRDQQASPSAVWWSLLHQDLDLSQLPGAAMDADSLRAFETACERSYPSSSLAPLLERSASRQVLTFVTGEPVHTLAVQAAWRTLAARVISHSPGLPEIAPSSAHLHAETAHLVADHLRCLRNLQASLASGAPRRLLARIELSRICADPWGCAELTRLAETAMRESAEACDDWLASLPPRDALEPDTRPIVLVYDAVPVDVWVRALDSVTADGYRLTWQRLDTVPHTVPSLRALLGIPEDCDPIEGAEALGMHYHTIDGSEEKPLLDLVPLSDAGTGILVRIAVFDRTAHAGGLRLENMAERFTTLLDRHIRALRTACSDAGRPLLLTTDHGLSYQHGKLTHGTEGVYERALPLVQLDRPAE